MSSDRFQKPSIKPREVVFSNEVFIPEVVKMLDAGHTVTLRLRGISMRPFLEDNRDKALLTKAICLRTGDAVLAEINPKHYVLHRIIQLNGDNVTLRGDGNLSDEHCKIKDVKGTVVGFYRKGRNTMDRTSGFKWRMYSYVWVRLFPIRRYLLYIYRHFFL